MRETRKVANTNKVVELNGNYYDAASGAMVPADNVQQQHVASMRKVEVVARPAGYNAPKSMDGMSHRAAARPLTPHQPSKSSTLMRHAVKQPLAVQAPEKAAVKAHAPMDAVMVQRLHKLPTVAPKASAAVVHPMRAQRARATMQSDVVRRFSQPRPVVAAPAAAVAEAAPKAAVVIPAKAPVSAQTAPQPKTVSDSTDVFSHALAAAAEHQAGTAKPAHAKNKKRRGKRGKKTIIAGAALALALAVGTFVYMNKPVLQMHLASMRSGISASLPDYTPLGFGVSNMQYSAGAVKVAFNGPSGQNFSIDQKKSNWDSDTLMDNFVATTDKSYNAYQANGRTVFIYGKGNATWVNGGIWYQLQSNGLSDDEMLKVASTM